MKSENDPILKPETIEHTKKQMERSMAAQMPIGYSELTEITEDDPLTKKAFEEMNRYAQSYIADVWEMRELVRNRNDYDDEEWKELFASADDKRTRLHNTFIDSVAILIRNMNLAEQDTSWARELAPTGKLERAACGKFAIMLVYSQYVNTE